MNYTKSSPMFFTSILDNAISRMKDIDKLGSFEANDETGYVFKELYEIVEQLEVYYNGEKSEE